MISQSITYPTAAGLDHNGNPFQEDHERTLGGGGEGVYGEGSLRANGNKGEVLVDEVSRKGEREGILERLEVEKRGIGAGRGKDQRQRISLNHHFFIAQPASQFCLVTNVLGTPAYLETNRCQYIDDNVIARSRVTDPTKSKM